MRVETVFIFSETNEAAQLESARKKAQNHPHGLSNVCYHKYGETHNTKCYTLDIFAEPKDGEGKIL